MESFTRLSLLRTAGISAFVGGALRLIAAVPALPLSSSHKEGLYLVIDVLLTLALFGMFASESRFRTWPGTLGLVGAVVGFQVIRTGDRLCGPGTYQLGSSILVFALAIAGVSISRAPGFMRFAGWAWIASMLIGLSGTALHLAAAFLVASLLFVAGFILGGMALMRSDLTY